MYDPRGRYQYWNGIVSCSFIHYFKSDLRYGLSCT